MEKLHLELLLEGGLLALDSKLGPRVYSSDMRDAVKLLDEFSDLKSTDFPDSASGCLAACIANSEDKISRYQMIMASRRKIPFFERICEKIGNFKIEYLVYPVQNKVYDDKEAELEIQRGNIGSEEILINHVSGIPLLFTQVYHSNRDPHVTFDYFKHGFKKHGLSYLLPPGESYFELPEYNSLKIYRIIINIIKGSCEKQNS
ncbi:hypothetical protein GOV12_07800 [Candidatus Pacearchaeota archaeon]|nr:hypothetical protein [Candidatus Pacearchaeota archaeon]